jgi:hypothetical protein
MDLEKSLSKGRSLTLIHHLARLMMAPSRLDAAHLAFPQALRFSVGPPPPLAREWSEQLAVTLERGTLLAAFVVNSAERPRTGHDAPGNATNRVSD